MDKPNLNYILNLSKGDVGFQKKILQVIKNEFPVEVQLYKKHLAAGQFEAAAGIVHKLKHKMAVLGMEQAYNKAMEHENALREADVKNKIGFDAYLEIINEFIESCEI